MKKIILTSAIIFGAVAATLAQTSTATTTLNVNLNPLQTIEVNSTEVNLNYATKDDYKNGVTAVRDNHLTIYSTGGFEVNVKAATDAMKNGVATQQKEMKTSKITVLATKGSTNVLEGSAFSAAVPLKMAESILFNNTTGGVDKNFAVTYKGAGGDAFVNNYTKGDGATVYTTTVTYSIVAK